jgi:S-adenosylmethionine/arginine decarboxylase-like enzyme
MTPDHPIAHLSADFLGVASTQLSDQALLSGIMISAAGAAGLGSGGTATVIVRADGGLSVILPLQSCHMSLHTFPGRQLALLDILAPEEKLQLALDVVARRLNAQTVRTERRARGLGG